MSNDNPVITPRENGPLIAKNVKKFRLPDGTFADEDKPIRALCRCGQSKNKPYCDGSHNDLPFNSDAQDVNNQDHVYHYAGAQVTVHFNKLLCSHAAECGRIAPQIFNANERPWIKPDNGALAQVEEVIRSCPSGALRMEVSQQQIDTSDSGEPSISVQPDGPLWVSNIPIEADYWAEGQSDKKYVLCRCGLSKNKPFCDGSHMDEGWKAE